jgi:acyl-CoA dehydrogenase
MRALPTPRCTPWARSSGMAPKSKKESTCRRIARGDLRLQAFAVTEPEAGTDTTSIKTMATREGDHYIVHGRKIYISRVEQSDLLLLLARTRPVEEVEKRSSGLSVFLVDLREGQKASPCDQGA